MSDPPTNFAAWLGKAEHDFQAIRSLIAGPERPWDVVCFHAQQGAEKCLKAFLVFHKQPVPRTHDLVQLLAACAQLDRTLSPLEEGCARLTNYAVLVRYPGELVEPTEEEARSLAETAEHVRNTIAARLSPPRE